MLEEIKIERERSQKYKEYIMEKAAAINLENKVQGLSLNNLKIEAIYSKGKKNNTKIWYYNKKKNA